MPALARRSLLTVVGVTLTVIGPKILGHATDLIFAGVIGRQLPAGITQQQAIDAARARGDDGFANLLSGMTVVPGQGIDFAALARVLLLVLCLYVAVVAVHAGCRATCSTAWCSARCCGCAPTSRTSCTGCRCATSTPSRAASC